MTGVSLSSDFIAGFCGETEEDHLQTVSLLREVQYNMGFLFAYSMRQVRLVWGRAASNPDQRGAIWIAGQKRKWLQTVLVKPQALTIHFFFFFLLNSCLLYDKMYLFLFFSGTGV
jgi:hypothetical protein